MYVVLAFIGSQNIHFLTTILSGAQGTHYASTSNVCARAFEQGPDYARIAKLFVREHSSKGQIMRALLKFVCERSSKDEIMRALLKFVRERSSKGHGRCNSGFGPPGPNLLADLVSLNYILADLVPPPKCRFYLNIF